MLWNHQSYCLICDQYLPVLNSILCDDCRPHVIHQQTHILTSKQYHLPPLITQSIFSYYGPLHLHFLHSKYQGDLCLYRQLIQASLSNTLQQKLSTIWHHYDYLIPIPFRVQHLKRRGFSSAYEIAYCYQKKWPHLKIQSSSIKRIKNTVAQSNLNRAQREQAQSLSLQAFHVKNKKVILIDDVSTTGSTLLEAARACYHAGAQEVCALSLMSALSSNDQL